MFDALQVERFQGRVSSIIMTIILANLHKYLLCVWIRLYQREAESQEFELFLWRVSRIF